MAADIEVQPACPECGAVLRQDWLEANQLLGSAQWQTHREMQEQEKREALERERSQEREAQRRAVRRRNVTWLLAAAALWAVVMTAVTLGDDRLPRDLTNLVVVTGLTIAIGGVVAVLYRGAELHGWYR